MHSLCQVSVQIPHRCPCEPPWTRASTSEASVLRRRFTVMRRSAARCSAWSALEATPLELRGVSHLDVPDEPEPLEAADHPPRHVDLAAVEPVPRRRREGMVVVVPALAEDEHGDEAVEALVELELVGVRRQDSDVRQAERLDELALRA